MSESAALEATQFPGISVFWNENNVPELSLFRSSK